MAVRDALAAELGQAHEERTRLEQWVALMHLICF